VEVLAKGQTQWIPAVVGARLAEGDDIRAYSGATVELGLPDASTVVVAENSRLLLTKMEYDPQSQSRLMLMHLVVGKVRATVAQAAVTLARVRQCGGARNDSLGLHGRPADHDGRRARVRLHGGELPGGLEAVAGRSSARGRAPVQD
jgi:hypothetical protein